MKTTIGCIGCGTMGGAIMAALSKRLDGAKYDFCGCNRSQAKMEPLRGLGIRPLPGPAEVAAESDLLIIAVKPHQVANLLPLVRPALSEKKIVISLAAGVSLSALGALGPVPVARCMPNTPARVGAGVFAFCFNSHAACFRTVVFDVFGKLGLCLEIPEKKFTAFSALIGAGPAYVFALMQAVVQAGVTLGFSHAESRRMTEELFGGCAVMARNMPERHLMAMRDEVCSPAGLTIAGVNHMDDQGLAGKLIQAVLAANRRGQEMES